MNSSFLLLFPSKNKFFGGHHPSKEFVDQKDAFVFPSIREIAFITENFFEKGREFQIVELKPTIVFSGIV